MTDYLPPEPPWWHGIDPGKVLWGCLCFGFIALSALTTVGLVLREERRAREPEKRQMERDRHPPTKRGLFR